MGLYAHLACWLHELYLLCGSHICLMIYVKYVYTCYVYAPQIVGMHVIYAQFGGYISFWHIFGNSMYSTCCSCLYFGISMQRCYFHMLIDLSAMWAIFAMWQPYLFIDACKMCTMLLVTSLMMVASYVACVCIYIFHISPSNIWIVWHVWPIGGQICSGTYLVITSKEDIALGFCLMCVCKNVGSICLFSIMVCDIYLQCGIHISSVINVKYVCSAPGHITRASDFGIYVQFGAYIYFWYICGNNMCGR